MHTDTPVIPYSIVPGITWPALSDTRAVNLLALLQQFDQSQWWPLELLRERQMQQAQRLLLHAGQSSPGYRERLTRVGLPADGRIAAEDWSRVPMLLRAELQAGYAALRSTALPSDHGSVQEDHTSGSTGRPVRFAKTALTDLFWRAFTLRDHLWHGRDFTQRLAVIRACDAGQALPPDGRHYSGWGGATDGIYPTGPASLLNIETDIEQQFDWLLRQDADYLLTYPTNLRALVQLSAQRGVRPTRLREVRTASESLDTDLRALMQSIWNVPLIDMYTTREAGYIALQCPQHAHYHVMAEGVLVEILNADNQACVPGEIGRVVVTVLHNFALPLIRYEIGDYAEVGAPCPCGRGLPVLTRILGRSRNMLTFPDGSRHWPRFGYSGFADIAPIRQLQLVQHSVEEIEARLVVDAALNVEQEVRFTAHLQTALGHPFRIRFTYLDSIPRSANGKYEDVLSLIDVDSVMGNTG
ncbi:MAG: phenylacetate--CoA ligase family protein [Gammaproteobacteria bacterium]|nr:phenylacetate--CoA ligase family protein [Gammaproteobacteria bacterium]